jgi:L-fuconolactonase
MMPLRQTRIIDAHHHFWDPASADYPWLTGPLEGIRRRFDPSDLRPELEANGVAGTIVIQTRSSPDETREFLEIASRTRFIVGVVGWVDLTQPGVRDVLRELRLHPGGHLLVGIRHQVHDEEDPDWLLRDDVRRGLRDVQQAGLAYDLLVRPRELPAALDTVRALPLLRFVIDHIAKPLIASGELEPWASLIAPFGQLPNAWCKVSGMVTEARWDGWTVDDLRPYVAHVLEVFGPGRLLFGSDWPVCLVAGSYERVLDATIELFTGLSMEQRADVFGGTARRCYRLSETVLESLR